MTLSFKLSVPCIPIVYNFPNVCNGRNYDINWPMELHWSVQNSTCQGPFLQFLSSDFQMRCAPTSSHSSRMSLQVIRFTVVPTFVTFDNTWRRRWSSSALQLLLFMHMWRYVRHLWDCQTHKHMYQHHSPAQTLLQSKWQFDLYLFLHSRGVFLCILAEMMCHLHTNVSSESKHPVHTLQAKKIKIKKQETIEVNTSSFRVAWQALAGSRPPAEVHKHNTHQNKMTMSLVTSWSSHNTLQNSHRWCLFLILSARG